MYAIIRLQSARHLLKRSRTKPVGQIRIIPQYYNHNSSLIVAKTDMQF